MRIQLLNPALLTAVLDDCGALSFRRYFRKSIQGLHCHQGSKAQQQLAVKALRDAAEKQLARGEHQCQAQICKNTMDARHSINLNTALKAGPGWPEQQLTQQPNSKLP